MHMISMATVVDGKIQFGITRSAQAQGYKLKHKAGLATTLMRSGDVERTAPGTFMAKGGAAQTGS
jgi:hypothetical protein